MRPKFLSEATREEREEWRHHPVTKLALEMVREEMTRVRNELLIAAGTSILYRINDLHGQYSTCELILSFLEKESER